MKEAEEINEDPIPLVYIGKEEDILAWKIDTDYSQGGNSLASLEVVENYCKHKIVLFQGVLQHFKELDYEGKLYCEITSASLPKKTFVGFNGVRLVVKSDGNQYTLNLYSTLSMNLLCYSVRISQALVQDTGDEWVTLELPFSNFVTDLGKAKTSISFITGELNHVKVEAVTFGIYSHDQKEGKFKVMIKSLEAIYKKEFEGIGEKYPYPVMFKKIFKGGVDTGRTFLRFEKVEEKGRNKIG